MTLLIWCLWLLAVTAVWHAVHGPRRRFERYAPDLRPGAEPPTEAGFRLLRTRDWWLAIFTVAVAVWVTVDTLVVSQDELSDLTVRAASLSGSSSNPEELLEAHLNEISYRHLRVDNVTETLAPPNYEYRARDTIYLEISVGDSSVDPEPSDSGPKTCVSVERYSSDNVSLTSATVSGGECKAE